MAHDCTLRHSCTVIRSAAHLAVKPRASMAGTEIILKPRIRMGVFLRAGLGGRLVTYAKKPPSCAWEDVCASFSNVDVSTAHVGCLLALGKLLRWRGDRL